MENNIKKDTIIGKIESAIVKQTGTTDKGQKWSRLEVVINGQKFSTFDTEFLAMIGIEGTFDFKIEDRVSPRGTPYQSRTLFNLPKPKKDAPDILLMEGLKKIIEISQRIEQKIDWFAERINPQPEPEDLEGDIKEEDLPF